MLNNVYLILAIYAIVVILFSLILLLIPLHVMGVMTKPFSFKTFGIRKVKRWNSRTDTLGNLFLWLSALLCICFPVIPFVKWIYLAWMILSWLACAARAVRLTQVHSTDKKLVILFLINMTFGFGTLAGMGFLNNFELWNGAVGWISALIDGSARQIIWYLNEPNLFFYLLQVIVMFLPLMIFWGQFKYMRLENTFKAHNIGFYVVKMLVWNVVIAGLGVYGYPLLCQAYNREAEIKAAVSLSSFPSDEAEIWSFQTEEPEDNGENEPEWREDTESETPAEPQPETEEETAEA